MNKWMIAAASASLGLAASNAMAADGHLVLQAGVGPSRYDAANLGEAGSHDGTAATLRLGYSWDGPVE